MTRLPHELEIDGPAFLASALIDGDESGLTRQNDAEILATFRALLPKGGLVVNASPDTWFGRWNGCAYDMCTYTVHYHTKD